MKKFYKSVFLTPFFLILSTIALAQCDFRGGDIAFTGYQIFDDNLNGSSKDDSFSFVLLRDAPAGLEIFFTDLGWIGTKFQEKENAPSDGIIKWKASADIPAGTQITITAKFNLSASIGEVTGVQNTQFGHYMDLGIAGDQLFAFTGTKLSPILLAGININKPEWDTGNYLSTFSSSTSVNPFLNNHAVQSISIGYESNKLPYDRKAYNAVLKPGEYKGKVPALISLLNNPNSWETDGTIYPEPIPAEFSLPSTATFIIAPPEITSQPKDLLVCLTDKPTFSVTVMATEACSYFWEVSIDGIEYTQLANVSGVYSGVNTPALKIENVEGLNGYFYRVKVKGAIETYSDPAKLEVILVSPIQNDIEGVNDIVYGEKTTFSVTGSKYASSYEWQVSKDNGATYQVIAVTDNNYQGAKTNALTLVKPTVAMSGYKYRVRVADKCMTVDSKVISLTVAKRELTVTAKNSTKIYDGKAFTQVEAKSYSGFVHGEDETVLSGSLVYVGEVAINVSDNPYEFSISGLTSDNYTIVYGKSKLTIVPAALTIRANSLTKIYGENNPLFTVVYVGLVNSETSIPDLSVTTTADKSSPVGEYDILVSGTAVNYTITFDKGSLNITKKALTVTAENKTKVYGEANPEFSLVYNGLVNGETLIPDLSVTTTAKLGSSVGDYAITVSGTSPNYDITFVSGTLRITRKAVTVNAEDKSKVYGEANPALTLTYNGLVNEETSIADLTISTIASPVSPVATYPIVVSGTSPNYEITFVPGAMSVTPKAVTVSAENKSKVYGQANPVLTLVYVGLVNGETSIPGLSVTTTATGSSSVGEFDILVSGTAVNYTITFEKGTLNITKKGLTVTADNKSKVYGQDNPALTLTYDGLLNGETSIPDLSITTAANASSPVGNYAIKVSGTAKNYSITFIDGILSVTKKPVGVAVGNKSRYYGDANPPLTMTYSGLANGETSIPGLTVSTTAVAESPVGEYDISISGTADNYSLNFIIGKLRVNPRPLTVRAENKTKFYGDKNPVLTLVYEGLADHDDRIDLQWIVTPAVETSPVGEYKIDVNGFGANYDITFVKGILKVIPREIKVSAENKTKVYGEVNPTLTIVYEGLVNGETSIPELTITTVATASSDVGKYPIKISGSISNSNYAMNFVEGTLSVTPKNVKVSAENKSKVYGEVNPKLTFVYEGLINGESSIPGILTITSANTGSPVGKYAIKLSGSSNNYAINFVEGTLSITPKSVTLSADNKSKVYGEINPALTFVYDGLVNGESSIPGLTVSTVAMTNSSIGDYPIKISGVSNNYSIIFRDGVLKINPKPIKVTANNQSKLFAEADPILTYTVNPVLIGNDKLSGALAREPGESEGSYLIKQNTLQANANYDISFIAGELTIKKETLSGLSFKSQSFIYDGKEHSLWVENLPVGAKVVYSNNGQSNAGTYTVTATIRQENFNDLVLNSVLTILKANASIHADDIQTHVYDGTFKNVKASLNHNESTLFYRLQQGYSEAGTYDITVYSEETKNYLASTKNVRLIIQQGSFNSLVFKDKEVVYNGKPQSIFLENLPAAGRVEYSGNGQIDAGSYTVKARVIDPNFKETTFSANLIIRKAEQQITFEELGKLNRNLGRVALKVRTTSGLPITVESDNKLVASVDGNDLLIHRLGTARLSASQTGDKNYEEAKSVNITVQVVDEVLGQVNVHKALSPNGDGINDYLIVEGIKDFPENNLQILTRNGLVVFEVANYDNVINTFQGISNNHAFRGSLPRGTYFYILKYRDNGELKTNRGWFIMKW